MPMHRLTSIYTGYTDLVAAKDAALLLSAVAPPFTAEVATNGISARASFGSQTKFYRGCH